VALTANAIAGQAEMFMENGFEDFISKPIDTRQLNLVLNKYVRDKQAPEVIAKARGRIDKKVSQAFEPAKLSPEFVQLFLLDAKKAMAVLDEVYAKRESYTPEDIRNFIIHAHAVKSALSNIGELELSNHAARLEEWGRAGNLAGIFAETPGFLSQLRMCMERLNPKETAPAEQKTEAADEITGEALEIWASLRDACFALEKKTAKSMVTKLTGITKSTPLSEVLGKISIHLLHSAFDEAGEAAKEVVERYSA
jgi:HPt (histidine-containing phosphotransfer) domain-containing protein